MFFIVLRYSEIFNEYFETYSETFKYYFIEYGFALGSDFTKYAQLELLDLSSWTWETRTPYFTDGDRFATLYNDGNLYVFGGFSTSSGPLNDIQSYNPKTDTWTDRGRLLKTHYYHDVIFSSGAILVLGDRGNNKSEKCVFNGDSLICEEQQTIFGSVE